MIDCDREDKSEKCNQARWEIGSKCIHVGETVDKLQNLIEEIFLIHWKGKKSTAG